MSVGRKPNPPGTGANRVGRIRKLTISMNEKEFAALFAVSQASKTSLSRVLLSAFKQELSQNDLLNEFFAHQPEQDIKKMLARRLLEHPPGSDEEKAYLRLLSEEWS